MTSERPPWAARLREERERRGWTKPKMARELHKAAGMSARPVESLVRQIRCWENGKHYPRDWEGQYAAAFGTTVAELFGDTRPSLWTPPAAETLTPDDEERLLLAAQRPARVDATVVDSLGTILAAQRRLEDAIGPAALVAPMRVQLETLTGMVRDTRGPHRDRLGRIVAEWNAFTGWLHAACHLDDRALTLWRRAEELADEFDDGMVAADAVSWPGHLALRQQRHKAVLRSSYAALFTPGNHERQRIFFQLRAARSYAALGEREQARRLIDEAVARAADAPEPPPLVYWHTAPFFEMYIGMVLCELGEYGDAADMLRMGIDGMPDDQRDAEWMAEYRDALTLARDRA